MRYSGAVISFSTLSPSHFGLALHVGDVPVPLRLLALSLVVQAGLGVLALLLGLRQVLLVQLAGQRPGYRQAAAVGHVSELFGTVRWGVRLIDVMEAVVVHLVEAILQRQDRREAVAPLDFSADIRTPRLAGHPWRHTQGYRVKTHSNYGASIGGESLDRVNWRVFKDKSKTHLYDL